MEGWVGLVGWPIADSGHMSTTDWRRLLPCCSVDQLTGNLCICARVIVWRLRRQPVHERPVRQGRRGGWRNLLQHRRTDGRETSRPSGETYEGGAGALPTGETEDPAAVLRPQSMRYISSGNNSNCIRQLGMLNEARKIETRFKTEYSKSIIQNRNSISHFLFFSAQYMPKSKQINQLTLTGGTYASLDHWYMCIQQQYWVCYTD